MPNDFDPWFNTTDNSTGPTCEDAGGKMARSQTGELMTSPPRDTTWAADGASWWEVCSITPSMPGCVDENVDAWKRRTVNQYNASVIDYRDLANIGAPGGRFILGLGWDGGWDIKANFKCAAFDWDQKACCPAHANCMDCTSCSDTCAWCVTPFGDGHCFDADVRTALTQPTPQLDGQGHL